GVDLRPDGLRLRRVEVVLFEEPAAVALQDPQGVERAQPAQRVAHRPLLGGSDGGLEVYQEEALPMGAGEREEVVLHLDEGVEGVHPIVHAALEAAGGGDEEVALAALEEVGVEGGIEEVLLGGAPPLERVRLAEAGLDALAELAEEAEEVEVLELLLVAGEQ